MSIVIGCFCVCIQEKGSLRNRHSLTTDLADKLLLGEGEGGQGESVGGEEVVGVRGTGRGQHPHWSMAPARERASEVRATD